VSVEAATAGEFVFGLGRKALARPRRVRNRVLPRDVDDRVIFARFDRAARPLWIPPVRARYVAPPSHRVIERNGLGRRSEDGGAGHEFVGRDAGKLPAIRRSL